MQNRQTLVRNSESLPEPAPPARRQRRSIAIERLKVATHSQIHLSYLTGWLHLRALCCMRTWQPVPWQARSGCQVLFTRGRKHELPSLPGDRKASLMLTFSCIVVLNFSASSQLLHRINSPGCDMLYTSPLAESGEINHVKRSLDVSRKLQINMLYSRTE